MFTPVLALTSRNPKFLLLAHSMATLYGTSLLGRSHLLPNNMTITRVSMLLDIYWNQLSNASKLFLLVQSYTKNVPTAFLKNNGANALNFSWPNVSQMCNCAHLVVFSIFTIFLYIYTVFELASFSLNISFTKRFVMLVFPTRSCPTKIIL